MIYQVGHSYTDISTGTPRVVTVIAERYSHMRGGGLAPVVRDVETGREFTAIPQNFRPLPRTYYMGEGQWGEKCPCGARETGAPHEWHAADCPRYQPMNLRTAA